MDERYQISVVIPVFNEADSLRSLVDRLMPVLNTLDSSEVIFVDDGSTDTSGAILEDLKGEYPERIKIIHLRKNFGKSVALQTGFQKTTGKFIVTIDADLQDQPEEIPNLLNYMIDNNYDIVAGWKEKRSDSINKKLFSKIFNYVMRRFSGLNIHDFNCGLKVMHRKCLEGMNLYGQLHRFMIVLLSSQGFNVGEMRVKHSPRIFGHSKYGNKRIYEGMMDFLTIFFITRYLQTPLYFFGYYGLFCFIFSLVIGGFFITMHYVSFIINSPGGYLAEHPIWILSPIFFIAGLICIFFGLIGELTIYLKSSKVDLSVIKNTSGFESDYRDAADVGAANLSLHKQ